MGRRFVLLLLLTHAFIATIKCQKPVLSGSWQLQAMNDDITYYNFLKDSVAIINTTKNISNAQQVVARVKTVMAMFKNTSIDFTEDGFYKMYGSKMGEENGKFSFDSANSILFFKKIIDLNLLDASYPYKLENNVLKLYAKEYQYGKMIYTFIKQDAE